MNDKNHLSYFLTSLNEELGFSDTEDFKNKVHLKNNLKFRIKIQKFVFLAKYFGWNNAYNYNIYHHGPYSPALADDYHSSEVFENYPLEIQNFDLDSFKEFVGNKSTDYLEAASTILYYKRLQPDFTINNALNQLNMIKPHIDSAIVENAYNDVKGFKLPARPTRKNIPKSVLERSKANLNNKILENMKLFEQFDVNYNSVFILGSLDYLRIVLREEDLNKYLKNDLINAISQYIKDIENIYSLCNGDNVVFENMNLTDIIKHFNRLQNYISQDLDVLPRLDDDSFDDSLFY